MPTKEDYQKMVEDADQLIRGGQRQIEIGAFIKDRSEALLKAEEGPSEGGMPEGVSESVMDEDGRPKPRGSMFGLKLAIEKSRARS